MRPPHEVIAGARLLDLRADLAKLQLGVDRVGDEDCSCVRKPWAVAAEVHDAELVVKEADEAGMSCPISHPDTSLYPQGDRRARARGSQDEVTRDESRAIAADAMHRRNLSQDLRVLRAMNSLPKAQGARKPFGPIDFVVTASACWATCPTTGFGFHYGDLLDAVQSWEVTLISVGLNAAGETVYRGEAQA